jgi:hypothetical protein
MARSALISLILLNLGLIACVHGSDLASYMREFAGVGVAFEFPQNGEGLFNQHIKVMSLMLTVIMGNMTFIRFSPVHTRVGDMGGPWADRNFSDFYDIDLVRRKLREKGVEAVLNVSELATVYPNTTVCQGGIGIPRGCTDKPDTNIDQEADLQFQQQNLRGAVEGTWQACKHQVPDADKKRAVILLGCGSPNEMYRFSHLPLGALKEAHDILQFNSRLRSYAQRITDRLGGIDSYNGMHLRLEGDSAYWLGHAAHMVNHHTMYWTAYYAAAVKLDLDHTKPLYVTSGKHLTEQATMLELVQKRFASKTVSRGDFLTADELQGLGADEAAIIDHVVLQRSAKLVGFPFSTFSIFLDNNRLVLSYNPNTTFGWADADGLLWDLGRHGYGTNAYLERLAGCWSFLPLKVPPRYV